VSISAAGLQIILSAHPAGYHNAFSHTASCEAM